MLIGSLGIRLIIWMGRSIPLPPSHAFITALQEVEVTNDADGPDGFRLKLSLVRDDPVDFGLVSSGSVAPMTRVVIAVLMGISPQVLIDGVITHHQLSPGDEPGMSTLTVMGKGLTQVLDLEERNESYENQPDYLIVSRIVGRYARYGLVPQPTPTSDVPIMLQRIPRQHETDLDYIERLAASNGYVFYIEPVTFGVNKAYWGPEVRAGVPQSALTIHMGAATNLNSIEFENDSLAPEEATGSFVEPITKLAIPIPSLASLRIPPLATDSVSALRRRLLRDTANENPVRAAAASVAAKSRAPEAVTGTGEIDSARYGKVLRARRPVGVRGVGRSYDGFYFVRRVTHSIARGRYTQSFRISREGTGSLTPAVPT